MDELIKSMNLGESIVPVVTIWSVLVGCVTSALLTAVVGVVYRKVHSESGYSQTLVHTFVIISMITALIMLIIGSNIARAFSLVGALSIIRFRTAIKSPLDVAFIFFAIAIGMSCGTRFYGPAVVATACICGAALIMKAVNFASYPSRREHLLSVVFQLDVDYESTLDQLLGRYFEAYSLSYTETIRQGTLREVVYSVQPRPDVKDKDFLDEIAKLNGNLKISFRSIRHAIEVP